MNVPILILQGQRMSEQDSQAIDSLPVRIGENLYSAEQRKLIDQLYKFYIESIVADLWVTYRRTSDRYLQTNEKPNQTQAKHTLLIWYRDFLRLETLSADEMLRQLWVELGKSAAQMAGEMLHHMYHFNYAHSTQPRDAQ
ncbi:MAG: hypothetical protein INR73_28420 [Williamsia sp.]|nr:hypothetical protein [Williamsia sp.]